MLTTLLAGLGGAAAVVVAGRPTPASRLARSAASPTPLAPVMTIGAVGLLVSAIATPAIVVVAGVAIIGGRWWRSRAAARERAARTTAVIESTIALAAELRAGRSPSDALGVVAEFAGPLAAVFASARAAALVGDSPGAVLTEASSVPGAERLLWVGAMWAVADGAGGRIAGALDRLAEAMDHDEELRQELDAALAAPHATMLLLAGLPVLGVAMGESVGAGSLGLLVHRPLGWALLAAAVFLDAAGLVATRAIVRRVLPS